jgi:hypothetical protein
MKKNDKKIPGSLLGKRNEPKSMYIDVCFAKLNGRIITEG